MKKYPKSKLSTLFLKLRNHPKLSFFGDYCLFAIAISECKKHGIIFPKEAIRKALKLSQELKNRGTIVDALSNG